MQQAAPDELCIDRHHALERAVAIVLPMKPDLAMLDIEQPMVGNGNPMDIAAKIVEQ